MQRDAGVGRVDLGVLRHPLSGAPPTHSRGDSHEPQQMAEKQRQQDGQDEIEGEDDVVGHDDVCHEGGEVVGEGLTVWRDLTGGRGLSGQLDWEFVGNRMDVTRPELCKPCCSPVEGCHGIRSSHLRCC